MADPAAPVFFIHLMKTGGTTVFRYLRDEFALDQLYPYRALDIRFNDGQLDLEHHLSVPYLLSLSRERRERIRVYTGHFPYVAVELMGDRFTTMTLLRDPVERTVSLLRQLTRATPWVDPDDRAPLSLPLEEVYDHPLVFEPLVHNHQTKVFSMTAEDDPMSFRDVVPLDEERLALAKQNLARIDVLGLTEQFDRFLDAVADRTGWALPRGLRRNAAPDEGGPIVSNALRRRILDDNSLDVELYEHARELLGAPSQRL